MESQFSVPRPSGEANAYSPQTLPPSPEGSDSRLENTGSPERLTSQELPLTVPAQPAASLPVPTQAAPPATTPVAPVLNPLGSTNDTPAAAADDEVIEKEWVDKAKKIVNQTKDDPYLQEKEVSKLQADYLKKRYGKDVKLSSD